jgi:hypothetical protein
MKKSMGCANGQFGTRQGIGEERSNCKAYSLLSGDVNWFLLGKILCVFLFMDISFKKKNLLIRKL